MPRFCKSPLCSCVVTGKFGHCCRFCPHGHSAGWLRRQERRSRVGDTVTVCSSSGCVRLVEPPHRRCCKYCPVGHSERCHERAEALEAGARQGSGSGEASGSGGSKAGDPKSRSSFCLGGDGLRKRGVCICICIYLSLLNVPGFCSMQSSVLL